MAGEQAKLILQHPGDRVEVDDLLLQALLVGQVLARLHLMQAELLSLQRHLRNFAGFLGQLGEEVLEAVQGNRLQSLWEIPLRKLVMRLDVIDFTTILKNNHKKI